MMLSLPLHLREASHTKEMQVLCEYLYSKPDGTYDFSFFLEFSHLIMYSFLSEIYVACKSVDKHHIMQYLNLLVKSGDIVKQSRKV